MRLEAMIKLTGILAGLAAAVFFGTLFYTENNFGPSVATENGQAKNERAQAEPPSTALSVLPERSSTTAKVIDGVVKHAATSSIPVLASTKKQAAKAVPKKSPTISTPGPLYVEKANPGTSPGAPATTTAASSTASTTLSKDLGIPNTQGALNQKDIFDIVNKERAALGLSSLSFNTRLSAMAEIKAVDMINKNYFAHVSPDGTDVKKLAERMNYEYLNLGENLAMGDFVSSKDVMNGWMNSPGHRANILNKNYTEIGISAVEGSYQGRMVWWAVQEFGRPIALCSKPDSSLHDKVTLEEAEITRLDTLLANLRTLLDNSAFDRDAYNAKIDEFNAQLEINEL